MPELPDVTVYVEALRRHVRDRTLDRVRLKSVFLVRTPEPPISRAEGRRVREIERIGKRIVFEMEGGPFLVFHLMVTGRFKWRKPGVGLPGRMGLAAFDFEHGTLLLTEAGRHKRASLHLMADREGLAAFDAGGLDVLAAGADEFGERLRSVNHTLKRALTSPRLFDGIGNAYSDEILHRARLSPLQWTSRLSDEEVGRLHGCTREVLREWIERTREEVGEKFPEKVTAFREGMAVHGRYGQPCPDCGSPVQRIVRAENEINYCATCQTGGKVYADRALSKLLKGDWPRTIEEWEGIRGGG